MEIKHLTQAELAKRWAMKESSLENWRRRGCGPIYLKLNGLVLYRIVDVEAFEQSHAFESVGQRVDRRGSV